MSSVRTLRLDEILRRLEKPTLEQKEGIELGREDVLIVCAGFEERSVEILRRAVVGQSRGFKAVRVEYLPPIEANRISEVRELCASASARSETFIYDRRNPESGGERLFEMAARSSGTVHLDISGMSRLLIVQCLVAMRPLCAEQSRLRVWYCEARDYPPAYEDVRSTIQTLDEDPARSAMFLSSGVFGVTIVPELAATALHGSPIRLVIFPSFNTAQLVSLRTEISASRVTIVNGIPPRQENRWRTDAIRQLNHVDRIADADEVSVSTLDYRETLEILLDRYSEYEDREKFVIAPVGSKMQAVAVGMMRAFLNDVEVAYPTPESFDAPERYSHGVRRVYSLDLSAFGAIESARATTE